MAKKNQIPEKIKVVVTEEHLIQNPELVEQGVKVGEEIEIPNPEFVAPTPKVVKASKSGVTVNFGVYIPSMGKSFSKEEIEANEAIINYLIDIKSEAVSVN